MKKILGGLVVACSLLSSANAFAFKAGDMDEIFSVIHLHYFHEWTKKDPQCEIIHMELKDGFMTLFTKKGTCNNDMLKKYTLNSMKKIEHLM